MKTLQILIIILLCATPLYADQALILTELEKIQEKIWHLQRTVAAQETLIKEQQKQLKLYSSQANGKLLELNEQLTVQTQAISSQMDKTGQIEAELQKLNESLTTLANEVSPNSSAMLEQAERINTLDKSLQSLQSQFTAKQKSTDQELAETRRQLMETRAQFDELGQNVGGRIERFGLLGGGAALILAIVLTVSLIFRRSSKKKAPPERKHTSDHEM